MNALKSDSGIALISSRKRYSRKVGSRESLTNACERQVCGVSVFGIIAINTGHEETVAPHNVMWRSPVHLAESDADNALTPLQAASCTYRIALGPRAGQKVLSMRSLAGTDQPSISGLCANLHGFSLHAAVCLGADQRKELERLCRYITRPAIANERLRRNHAGQVVLHHPRRDVAAGVHATPRRPGAAPQAASDPLSRRARPQRQAAAAIVPSPAGRKRARSRARARASFARAHELGALAQTGFRHRH
jgi:hypothetical protein